MNDLTQAFESISNWWYELHYSRRQKRALLLLTALILAFSSLIMVCGNVFAVSPGVRYCRRRDGCGF